MQRMDSPTVCATSCATSNADESNHSAAGMLHPHRSAKFSLYVIAQCDSSIQRLLAPSYYGYPPNHILITDKIMMIKEDDTVTTAVNVNKAKEQTGLHGSVQLEAAAYHRRPGQICVHERVD